MINSIFVSNFIQSRKFRTSKSPTFHILNVRYNLNMQRSLSWQAFSNGDRNRIIEEIKNAISATDGYILNFNMFSDLALTLCIEIEENKIESLHKLFSSILNVSELKFQEINQESKKEWLIFVNTSFAQGKGELKQEIPDVPG